MASKAVAKAAGGAMSIAKVSVVPTGSFIRQQTRGMATRPEQQVAVSSTSPKPPTTPTQTDPDDYHLAAANFPTNPVSSSHPISQKATLQSEGVWERMRRFLAIDPERSNGVPLNPYFRNPAPGSDDPLAYDDPVTLPAGDIADNAYWKRDSRRSYARSSVVSQAQQVALLTVGSAAQPRVELIGEAGTQALVAAEDAGKEAGGLAAYLEKSGAEAGKLVLQETGGLPPLPSGETLATGKWDVHKYGLTTPSYSDHYPCRSFA
ncbi:hypothetical protein B0T17DRAFT_63738 [Bombardia bombarda]|uniref:NADH dehydrogenase [ubiquinone] 1 alpha subcomplex subunit 7 n=1 Tax=Bombardia bombarda TaxID=252184 RepID=A0AA39XL50_9PEZI|nr:hypothetical protein B0T17DRAFT_63738 [Bombardia bombarda]